MSFLKKVVSGVLSLSPTFKKVAKGIEIAESVTNVVSSVVAKSDVTPADMQLSSITAAGLSTLPLIKDVLDKTASSTDAGLYISPDNTSYEHFTQVAVTLTALLVSYRDTTDDAAKLVIKSQINAVKREIAIIVISQLLKKGVPKIITYIEKWIGYVKK